MSSSKFATPFFQKSPLHGAYSQGAGGMVAVSYADVHSKFQDNIAKNIEKAYAKKKNPCDDPTTVQYTENSVLKKCPKKTGNTSNDDSISDKPVTNNAIPKGPIGSFFTDKQWAMLLAETKKQQEQAVSNINKAKDPNRNNQIQEEEN